MTLLIIMAAMLAQPSDIPPAEAPPITVVAERMRRLKLETRTDRKTGVQRCVFKRSSGDAKFDTLMCDAVLGCAKTVKNGTEMEACVAPSIASYARDLSAPPIDARGTER